MLYNDIQPLAMAGSIPEKRQAHHKQKKIYLFCAYSLKTSYFAILSGFFGLHGKIYHFTKKPLKKHFKTFYKFKG